MSTPEPPLPWLTAWRLLNGLVAKHPDLGVDDSAERGANGDDRLLEESKYSPRRRKGDLADLVEHADLACVRPQSVKQLDGFVLTSIGDDSIGSCVGQRY